MTEPLTPKHSLRRIIECSCGRRFTDPLDAERHVKDEAFSEMKAALRAAGGHR